MTALPQRPASPTACRYCVAAWPGVFDERGCEHNERHGEVARQIASRVHETPDPTDEQVGWFMDDAVEICAIVPDEHPVVTRWNPNSLRLTVSGHRFVVADEGGGLLYRGKVR